MIKIHLNIQDILKYPILAKIVKIVCMEKNVAEDVRKLHLVEQENLQMLPCAFIGLKKKNVRIIWKRIGGLTKQFFQKMTVKCFSRISK